MVPIILLFWLNAGHWPIEQSSARWLYLSRMKDTSFDLVVITVEKNEAAWVHAGAAAYRDYIAVILCPRVI